MKQLSTFLFLLLCAIPCNAQVVIGDAQSSEVVDAARLTLEKAAPKILKMGVDEFEALDLAKSIQQKQLYYFSSADSIVEREIIKAGQTHTETGVRAGTGVKKTWKFAAKPYDWSIVRSKAAGDCQFVILTNGGDWPAFNKALATSLTAAKADPVKVQAIADSLAKVSYKPPVELDRLLIQVAGAPVPPQPPIPQPPIPQPPIPQPPIPQPPIPQPPIPQPPIPQPPQPPVVQVQPFRVMMVTVGADDQLTNEQLIILNSSKIRAYVNSHAAKDDKGLPAFRRWTSTQDVSRESPQWQGWWGEVKPFLGEAPAVYIITDKDIVVYPFADKKTGKQLTEADVLKLLSLYGGA